MDCERPIKCRERLGGSCAFIIKKQREGMASEIFTIRGSVVPRLGRLAASGTDSFRCVAPAQRLASGGVPLIPLWLSLSNRPSVQCNTAGAVAVLIQCC